MLICRVFISFDNIFLLNFGTWRYNELLRTVLKIYIYMCIIIASSRAINYIIVNGGLEHNDNIELNNETFYTMKTYKNDF